MFGPFLSTIVSSMAVPPHLRGHIPYKQTKIWETQIQIQSHSNPDQWLFGGSGEQVFNDKDCIVKYRNAELKFSKFKFFYKYTWIRYPDPQQEKMLDLNPQ